MFIFWIRAFLRHFAPLGALALCFVIPLATHAQGNLPLSPTSQVPLDNTPGDEDDIGQDFFALQGSYANGGNLSLSVNISASGSCAGQNGLSDSVSRTCIVPNPAINVIQSSFSADTIASATQPLPALVSLTDAGPATGMTVAAALDINHTMAGPETIFTIYPYAPGDSRNDGNGLHFAFTLIRDTQGFWHTGKFVDGILQTNSVYYLNRGWDPRSPCVTPGTCTSDTIYVTFMPSGQIFLDEFAMLAATTAGQSPLRWNSGSLLYGYPVTGYQIGGATAVPTGAPLFYPAATINLGGLPKALFTATPTAALGNYEQAPLTALILTASGTAGTGLTIANYWDAILTSQHNQLGGAPMDYDWVPCNSGSFQIYSTTPVPPATQSPYVLYHPSDMNTPCTPKGTVDPKTWAIGSVSPVALTFSASTNSGSGIHITSGAATASVLVKNATNASANLTVGTVSLQSFDPNNSIDVEQFSISQNDCTSPVAPGGSCSIAVTFAPEFSGTFNNAQLVIPTNAAGGGQSFTVPISAGLVAPTVTIASTTNHSFIADVPDLAVLGDYVPTYTGVLSSSDSSFTGSFTANCSSWEGSPIDFLCSGLSSGVQYVLSIAMTANGVTSPVTNTNVTTTVSTPTGLAEASPTSTGYNLVWNEPNTISATSTVDKKVVSLLTGKTMCEVLQNLNRCTVTGQPAGYTDQIQIVETLNGISSSPSAALTVNTSITSVPAPAISGLSNSGFTVTWADSNTYAVGTTPTYTVHLTNATDQCVGTTSNQCVVTGLQPATSYSAGIEIDTPANDNPFAFTRTQTLLQAPTIGFPSSASNTGFTVNWTEQNNLSASIVPSYVVQVGGNTVSCASSSTATSCVVTGLTSASTYTVSVTETVNGISATATNSSEYSTSLVSPTILAVTGVGANGFTVNWKEQNSLNSNLLPSYWVLVNGASQTCASGSTATSCVVTGLVAATHYTVTLTETVGTAEASASTSCTTVLTPPALQTATSVTNTGFTVHWNEQNSLAAGRTPTYTVLVGGATKCSGTASTQCAVSGLSSGASYSVVVTEAVSGVSATSTVQTDITTVAPVNTLQVSNANMFGFTVGWVDPNTAGLATPQYVVTLNGNTTSCSQTSTTCTFAALSPSSYTVGVKENLPSASSTVSTVAASTATLLNYTKTNVSKTSSSLTITFSDPNNWGGQTPQYLVQVSSSQSNLNAQTGYKQSGTSFSFTGLSSGTTYWYQVSAYNSLFPVGHYPVLLSSGNQTNNAALSPIWCVISETLCSPLRGVPGPSSGAVTANAMYWTDPNTYPDSNVFYTVTATPIGSAGNATVKSFTTSTLPTSANPFNLAGLNDLVEYDIVVTSMDDGDPSDPSADLYLDLPTAAPVVAVSRVGNSTLAVSWTDTNIYPSGVTPSYSLTLSGGGTCGVSGTTATCTGLNAAKNYTASVVTTVGGVTSPAGTASATTPVAAPNSLSSSAVNDTGFTASWIDSNSYAPGVTPSYTVCVSPSTVPCSTMTSLSNRFTGLTPGTSYTFSVFAMANGVTSSTATSNALPTTTFSAPQSVKITSITNNSLKVSWTDPNVYTAGTSPSYTVSLNGAGSCSVSGSLATCTGLTAATSYTVGIVTSANGLTSAAGTPTNAFAALTGINAPSSLSVTNISAVGFTVGWSDTNLYASGEVPSYTITLNGSAYDCSHVGTSCACSFNGNSCMFTGLTPGAASTVAVSVTANGVASAFSGLSASTLPLAPPVGLNFNHDGLTTAEVSWSDPNVLGDTVPTYTVSLWNQSSGSSSAQVATVHSLSYIYSYLTAGQTWVAEVQETAGGVTSSWSSQITDTSGWNANPLPGLDYSNCSNEGSRCLFLEYIPNYLAFGTANRYDIYPANGVPNSDLCSTSNMGGIDPYHGQAKTCSSGSQSPYYNLTACASEGGSCTAGSNGAIIYFEALVYNSSLKVNYEAIYLGRLVPNQTVSCSTSTFGDPAHGSAKHCYLYNFPNN